jgi:hypothetical protein
MADEKKYAELVITFVSRYDKDGTKLADDKGNPLPDSETDKSSGGAVTAEDRGNTSDNSGGRLYDEEGNLNKWLTLSERPPAFNNETQTFEQFYAAKGYSLVDTDPIDIQGRYAEYMSQCDGTGTYTTEIVVRHSPGLEYNIITSHGSLGHRSVENEDTTTLYDLNGESSIDTAIDLESASAPRLEWQGDVYDENGNQIQAPTTGSIDGSFLDFDSGVVGTVSVETKIYQDVFTLTLAPGQVPADSKAAATVRAFYPGGIATLQISMPNLSGNCTGFGDLTVTNGKDKKKEAGENGEDEGVEEICYEVIVTLDGCNKKELNREELELACKADEDKKEDSQDDD